MGDGVKVKINHGFDKDYSNAIIRSQGQCENQSGIGD